MELGTIVSFGNKNFVLAKTNKKTIKGVAEVKIFKELQIKPNFIASERPFTKARAASAVLKPKSELNKYELSDYNSLKKQKFEIWLN